MGMSAGSGEGGYVADINVTPMVDVIFMVVAPLLQSGVSVALPKSKNPEADADIIKETSAVIAITDKNEVYLGKDKLPNEDLSSRLKEVLKEKFKDKPPDKQVVYVKADQGVPYGNVVKVIDAIREAQYDRIGLVSDKEKEKGAGGGAAQ
jgi:biopolymer transport protein TolR